MDPLVEPVSDPSRRVAPGGWRRGVVGMVLGLLAGVIVARAVPRDGSAAPRDGSGLTDRVVARVRRRPGA